MLNTYYVPSTNLEDSKTSDAWSLEVLSECPGKENVLSAMRAAAGLAWRVRRD